MKNLTIPSQNSSLQNLSQTEQNQAAFFFLSASTDRDEDTGLSGLFQTKGKQITFVAHLRPHAITVKRFNIDGRIFHTSTTLQLSGLQLSGLLKTLNCFENVLKAAKGEYLKDNARIEIAKAIEELV